MGISVIRWPSCCLQHPSLRCCAFPPHCSRSWHPACLRHHAPTVVSAARYVRSSATAPRGSKQGTCPCFLRLCYCCKEHTRLSELRKASAMVSCIMASHAPAFSLPEGSIITPVKSACEVAGLDAAGDFLGELLDSRAISNVHGARTRHPLAGTVRGRAGMREENVCLQKETSQSHRSATTRWRRCVWTVHCTG